eukprot:PhF_6_TR6843/c0_g1_i1/m.9854/K01092/E3.1.3.25, IMPA, suhB; myo-inositol-1(or 4)-monophosphatase
MSIEAIDYDACLAVAVAAAQEAGALILKCMTERRDLTIDSKATAVDMVTQYDKACEDLVREKLTTFQPAYKIIGEETSKPDEIQTLVSPGTANQVPTWIVDPIDGTTSFIHSAFDCCVSIGLAVKGECVLGVVFIPKLNELYTAIKGRGAFLNTTTRLTVSGLKTVPGSLISMHYTYDRSDERIDKTNLMARELLNAPCHGIRMMGSAAMDMCSVAVGRLDLYFEKGVWAWDVCAGAVILREAGGVATDFGGEKLDLTSREIVAAASTELRDVACKLVKKYE